MPLCIKNIDDPTLKYFFARYICTYGRKRSTSDSDACLQDIDDDNGHHSHKEHTPFSSPSQLMYASLQINLFQTTEV